MQNNQKENLLSSKLIKDYLENESKSTLNNNAKLAEISSSLVFYLKSFSNIKKLLDYVCLILKHIFDQKLILIIPLNDEGEIYHENIKISANLKYLKTELSIRSFFEKFEFSKNFKIKENLDFEKSLQNNFKEYDKIEAFFFNPINIDLKVKINELSFTLKSLSSKLINLPTAEIYKVKSKCLLMRPILFVYKDKIFDVFHG